MIAARPPSLLETARLHSREARGILPGMPGFGEFIVIMLILSMSVVWVWMLLDCIRYENERDKVVWILVIVLAGILGALIYLFARRVPRRRTVA
jgi:phospholipase D-like protein